MRLAERGAIAMSETSGGVKHTAADSKIGRIKRHARVKVDAVPDGGRIASPGASIVQTILAVAFLILVTLVAFGAVMLLGELTQGNRGTYWMIELIFALLCGGAGALVGGSAV